MPKKTNNQISQKSLDRSRGVSLPNGNRDVEQKENNIISGKLDEIVKTIEKSYSNLTSKLDMVLSGINSKPDGQLGDSGAMSVMSIVSGGKDVSSSTKFESIKSDIKNMSSLWKKSMTTFNKVNPEDYAEAYSRMSLGTFDTCLLDDNGIKDELKDTIIMVVGKNLERIIKIIDTKQSNKSNQSKGNQVENNSNVFDAGINLILDGIIESNDLNKSIIKSMNNGFTSVIDVISNFTNKASNQVNNQTSRTSLNVKNIDDLPEILDRLVDPLVTSRKIKKEDIIKFKDIISTTKSIIESVSTLDVNDAKKNTTNIGSLFNSIIGLGEFDEKKIDNITKGLRKILWMTEKPDVMTKVGLWNRGLISMIIQNVIDRSAEAKVVEGTAIDSLSDFFNMLLDIQLYNGEDFNKTYWALIDLTSIYSENGPVRTLIENINNTTNVDKAIDNLSRIEELIYSVSSITKKSSLKEIVENQIKTMMIENSLKMILSMSEIGTKLDGRKLNAIIKNIEKIGVIIDTFNTNIELQSIKETTSIMIEMVKLTMISSLLSKFTKNGKKGIEATTNFLGEVKKLHEAIVSDLPTTDDDIIKKLDDVKDVIAITNGIQFIASTGALLAPLGILGLMSMKYEVKLINSIIEGYNDVDINEDTIKNLKDITKIVAVSAGIMLFGSLLVKLVDLGDLLSFTIGLSLFLAGTLKAYQFGSKGIDDKIVDAEKFGKLILVSGGVMLLGSLFMMIPNMFTNSILFSISLSAFMLGTLGSLSVAFSIYDLNEMTMDVERFGELISICSACLIIPSLLMSVFPDMGWIVPLFTVLLGGFIVGVLAAFVFANKIDPGLANTMDSAKNFAILIGISALSISIGAMAMDKYGWNTLGFAVLLTAFVGGVTAAYLFANTVGQEQVKSAKDFAILIGISALSISIGAMAMANYGWNTLGFAVLLTAFVGGVTAVYLFANKVGGEAMKSAKDFGILVAISAATLIIGGTIAAKAGGIMFASLGFAIGLSAFILLVCGAYTLATNMLGGAKGVKNAEELGTIVAISAATLIIGGLFMMIPGMWSSALLFAVTLGTFVGGMLFIYGFVAKTMNDKMKAAMIGLSALIVVSAATLLIGGGLMMMYPQLFGFTMKFLLCEALMVGGFSAIVWALGQIKKTDLIKGELALAGIEVLITASVAILGYLNNVCKDLSFDKVLDGIKLMGICIGATGGIVTALGLILTIPGAKTILATGAAALAAIEGLVWGAGKALNSIGEAMKTFNGVKKIKGDIITNNIGEFVKIFGALTPFMNPLFSSLLYVASSSIEKLSVMLAKMSLAVKTYSELKIPVYEGTKIIGYRKLTSNDFKDAGENVKTIVTTLGSAIIEVYKEDKNGMFNIVSELLGVDNPFTRVVKSCTGLGVMISKIAEGVREYAELKIPIYEGTKKVGYRNLTENDFKNAANNIKYVITTLGNAIIDTYKANPQLFTDPSVWHTSADKTPFGITVKACTGLGNMISGIAKAIKDVSELKMPIYDDNGQLKGYREMTPADFESAATNINAIVTCLGNSIIDTHDAHPEMFTDPSSWHTSADKTPFGMVVKAMTGIGGLISSMVKSIQDVANLKVPYVDPKTGQIVDGKYTQLKLDDISVNGDVYKKIMSITSVMPAAIMQVYGEHQEWFTDDSWWHTDPTKTPFGMVRACLDGLDKIFSSAVTAIKGMLDLKLTDRDFSFLKDRVYKVMSAMPDAIAKTCFDSKGQLKDIYKDEDDLSGTLSTVFDNYSKMISSCVGSYLKINKMLKELDKTDLGTIGKSISRMVKTIPFAFSQAYNQNKSIMSSSDIIDQIYGAFDKFNDVISQLRGVYKKALSIKKMVTLEDKLEFDESISKMNHGIERMFDPLRNIKLSDDVVKLLSNDFQQAMSQYNYGMKFLFDTYNSAPKDQKSYDLAINAIKNVNVEIGKVKNTQAFKTETEDVSKFTKTINSLDTSRATTFTNLVTALDSMARRLGGLDKLTNALANRLAVVLDKLVRELQISAKTINKADEMQRKRHAAIKESIKQISTLLNKPVEVKVTQEQQDMGVDGGMTQDTGGGVANDSEMNPTPAGSTGK